MVANFVDKYVKMAVIQSICDVICDKGEEMKQHSVANILNACTSSMGVCLKIAKAQGKDVAAPRASASFRKWKALLALFVARNILTINRRLETCYRNMGKKCAVLGCVSTRTSFTPDGFVSFHRVPKNSPLRQTWADFCKTEIRNKRFLICSLHFERKYFHSRPNQQLCGQNPKNTLTGDAVPTIYIPQVMRNDIGNTSEVQQLKNEVKHLKRENRKMLAENRVLKSKLAQLMNIKDSESSSTPIPTHYDISELLEDIDDLMQAPDFVSVTQPPIPGGLISELLPSSYDSSEVV